MITNKEKNFITAVVYLHNSEKTIEKFLKQLNQTLGANFESYEIICVNDFSLDKSVEIINRVANELEGCVLSIINMSFYQGLELSMNAGVDLAIGDFVFEFDVTDIDYDFELVMETYEHSLKGFDIVAASSKNDQKFTSKFFYKIYNKFANTQYDLATETFRILSRRAINRVHSLSKTIPYRKALYANCGLKIDTLKYNPTVVNHSSSTKEQRLDRKETAVNTLILFTNVAYKLAITMTLVMMLSTFGIGIYTIFTFALGKPVPGFTTIMLVMTGSFFGVFAIMAIMIKYLTLLVDLIFRKQKYIIESINKITK